MYSEILALVEKPVRYIGQEWNQIVKPHRPGLVRIALAFPDTYEIGMSHLGMRILYELLNRHEEFAAERVFCPWVDMERELRRFGQPLVTLETHTPLSKLDVVGFSLQFEMECTNVLTMLDLGGVPLHTEERTVEDPLVAAGGPGAFSPEPMAAFVDVFVIGDGEEAFPALVRRWAELRCEGGRTRAEMLLELSRLTGMYVPSLYRTELDPETGFDIVVGPRDRSGAPFPVRRALVDDLDRYPLPSDVIVPYGEIVHDCVSVEIARGCTEGCRFCQAGIIYRPVRERSPAEIIRSVSRGLRDTGYDEVSLTSLSTADYSCVTSLVATMMNRLARSRTAMSVSSMRVYGLTQSIAEQLARVRRTGFTIAPEAGTQRMRDLINKGISAADIDTAARIAWQQGWSQLKMYFMIGLPTETDEDVRGIATTGLHVYDLARQMGHKRAHVTLSVSSLVPKPHSTFQWEPMDSPEELKRKQRLILDIVRPCRNVRFKYHDVEEGVVECILSRGDRRVGRVIERAWRRGARFDSWSEHFDYERWMDCLREERLDPQIFLRRIPLHAALPWDHIDSLVTKEFIIRDLHKGMEGKFMPACEKPFIRRDPHKPAKPLEHANLVCYECGLECDLEAIKNERIRQRDSLALRGPEIDAAFRGERYDERRDDARHGGSTAGASATQHGEPPAAPRVPERGPAPGVPAPRQESEPAENGPRIHYRVLFSKQGDMRWLSHLDLVRTLQRTFKRAGIPVSYSQGFHPAPLMSFGPALAVGLEGSGELFEFAACAELEPACTAARLNASLPGNLRIRTIQRLPPGTPPLSRIINLGEYRAWINQERRALTPELFCRFDAARFHDPREQARCIRRLLELEGLVVTRRGKGTPKEVDIRRFIHRIEYLEQRREVCLWLCLGSQGQARPQEVLEALYSVPGGCFRVRRQALYSVGDPSRAETLELVLA
ncbi:MAG: TIGR03960 family B12-binding radical SAM protein [Candidatus Krumholzibacteriia bacterium]